MAQFQISIYIYSDKSEKEITEFTITPVELVVGENTINFVVKDNGKNVSVDFIINVVDKPTEVQPNEVYDENSNVDNTDNNNGQGENQNNINNKIKNYNKINLNYGFCIDNYSEVVWEKDINYLLETGPAIHCGGSVFFYPNSNNDIINLLIEYASFQGFTYLGNTNYAGNNVMVFEKNGIQFIGDKGWETGITDDNGIFYNGYSVIFQTDVNYKPFI
ncbi:MAG: hypothetical protein K6B15_07775 [Parasporobacterium sp.]|nr:hypothetical protein [Parasporobacterium sp.]